VSPTDNEAAWVAAARAGNVLCFEELVRRNQSRIFRLALGITGRREDAEDAVQEAFIKAYRHICHFRGDSLFSTWLTSIAMNEALLKLRKRNRHELALCQSQDAIEDRMPREVEAGEPTPEQRCAQAELWQIVSEAISKLEPGYRVVFLLRDVAGCSSEETGQVLGLSVPAVKSRLLRARLKLRASLDEHFRPPSSPGRMLRCVEVSARLRQDVAN